MRDAASLAGSSASIFRLFSAENRFFEPGFSLGRGLSPPGGSNRTANRSK
jgi:hypothetical protein